MPAPIDTSSLEPFKASAQAANTQAANLTASAPSLLESLRQNLTGIFTKNNPVMEARGVALEDFLNTPSATRAEILPGNMPVVEGSPLNLSPTQQNAIVTARQNAALVPLAGLNQTITGMYGNIPQMVQGAGNIYQGQIQGAQMNAQQAQQEYENAFRELQMQEQARQFNEELTLKKKSAGGGLASILAGMGKPTEAEPKYSPKGGIGAKSKGGEWEYTKQGWSPVSQPGLDFENLPPEVWLSASPAERAALTAYQSQQKTRTKAAEQDKDYTDAVKIVKSLKSKTGNVGNFLKYQTERPLATQTIARLYEKGRLSDEDRNFYLSLVPGVFEATFFPEIANTRLDQMIADLELKVGGGVQDDRPPISSFEGE